MVGDRAVGIQVHHPPHKRHATQPGEHRPADPCKRRTGAHQHEPEPAGELTFISSIEVPANPKAEGEGGGEWELLISKIRQWLESGEIQTTLQRARTPLLALGALLGLVLVLRVYGALLGAIDSLPLVSGLLELTGVIWLARFAATNLVRSSERQRLLGGLQRRWKAFFGTN